MGRKSSAWTKPRAKKGGSGFAVYLDRKTLRLALADAGLDPDTPGEDLEVHRSAAMDRTGTLRLRFRRRR